MVTENNKAENANDLAELSMTIEKYKKWLRWAGLGLLGAYVILQLLRTSTYEWGVLGKFSPDRLGQLGDYIGGILNPLVAFFALMALFQTTQLQAKLTRQQIEDERERTADANERSGKLEKEKNERELINDFYRSFDAYIRATDEVGFPDAKGVTTEKGKTAITNHLNDVEIDKILKLSGKISSTPIDPLYEETLKVIGEPKFLEKIEKINENTGAYFRLLYRSIELQDNVSKNLRNQNLYFLRAQLIESELRLIALNMLYTKKGREDMSKYAEEYALLRHLRHPNLKRLVEEEFSEECFKSGKLEYTSELRKLNEPN